MDRRDAPTAADEQRAPGQLSTDEGYALIGRFAEVGSPIRVFTGGRGFLFVSHLGEIARPGSFPIVTGNVGTHDVVEVYRDHPLLRARCDPRRSPAGAGACEFRQVCGGQRGRAYAVTGDPLASDSACAPPPDGMGRLGSGPARGPAEP